MTRKNIQRYYTLKRLIRYIYCGVLQALLVVAVYRDNSYIIWWLLYAKLYANVTKG